MKKHFGQKVALVFSVLCYLGAAGMFVGLMLLPEDAAVPVRGSFMASVVFFISCGIVLHVIGTARLKGIISGEGNL